MNPNLFQDMSSREGDGFVLALQLVMTTVLLAGLGYLIDRALGTTPLFTVGFGAFTLAYEVRKIVVGFDTELARHVAERRPLRQGPRP